MAEEYNIDDEYIKEGYEFKGRYVVLRVLKHGLVYLIKDKDDLTVSHKVLRITVDNEYKNYQRERTIISSLNNSERFVKYYEFFVFKKIRNCVVTEYFKNGSLDAFLESCRSDSVRIQINQIHDWNSQLIDAISYLHSNNIIHRDISPKNIFLTNDYKELKLDNFSFSKQLDFNKSLTNKSMNNLGVDGLCYYTSPEIIRGDLNFTSKVDIWSYGCVLYEIITLNKLFGGDSNNEIGKKITQGQFTIPDMDLTFKKLLERSLVNAAANRADVKELIAIRETYKPSSSDGDIDEQYVFKERYVVLRVLKRGQVYLIKDKDDLTVSHKVLRMTADNELKNSDREKLIRILNNSERFVKHYVFFPFRSIYNCVVTQYFKNGSLDAFLNLCRSNSVRIPLNQIHDWNSQLIDAISYLHSNGIIHSDISPKNIFLTDDYTQLKLDNFSSSKGVDLNKDTNENCNYTSPEIISGDVNLTPKVDIWSYGCVLYEIITLKKLFDGNSTHEIRFKIVVGKFTMPETDATITRLLERSLVKEVTHRADVKELIQILKPHDPTVIKPVAPLIRSHSFMPIESNKIANSESRANFTSPLIGLNRNSIENFVSMQSLDLSLPNDFIVTGCANGIIQICDVKSKSFSKIIEAHDDAINVLIDFPPGRFITGSADGTIRIFDQLSGARQQTFKLHTDTVTFLKIVNQTLLISASWDSTIVLYDISRDSRKTVFQGHEDAVCSVAVNSTILLSGSRDKRAKIWNLNTGQCEFTLEGHTETVSCVAIMANGFLITGSYDQKIRLWNRSDGTLVYTFEDCGGPIKCFRKCSETTILSGSWYGTIKLWSVETLAELMTFEGHEDCVRSIILINKRGHFASASDDGTIRIWSYDGSNGSDTQSNCLGILQGHENRVNCVKLIDRNLIASASRDGTVRLWNIKNKQCLHTFDINQGSVECLALVNKLNRI